MTNEIRFELTEDEYADLLEACRPVPYMVFNGVASSSPQENANAAWQHLGRKYGFVWDEVRQGDSAREFIARAAAS